MGTALASPERSREGQLDFLGAPGEAAALAALLGAGSRGGHAVALRFRRHLEERETHQPRGGDWKV
jgi:hypothetical protein